ncbi:MAG: aspartate aminotransferase family protein [Anaerolineae bacterium]
MRPRDYSKLLADLSEAWAQRAPRSAALYERAQRCLADGGSHAIRLRQPFPPSPARASGGWMVDVDGNRFLDLWQGHYASILGNNPPLVTSALAEALEGGQGLQTGFEDQVQTEVAEILCRRTGAERVRFTTSGTLATMYAIMLARAFTGRELVVKVGGGWHGAQPWGLKGVSYHDGFQAVESEGLPPAVTETILVTRFNDPQRLEDCFRQHGDRIACLIVEPCLGAGGMILASPAYLATARELTRQYGALLILDEVISGFRFRAGDLGALYGIRPDLATFGKVIGGGMPLAAVAGREDVLALVGRRGGSRVKFSGGTYSAHPATMLAAKTMLSYLVEHEHEVYPYLARLGQAARVAVAAAFTEEGIEAVCTGAGNEVVPGSSLVMVHFPRRSGLDVTRPDALFDPAQYDVTLSHAVLDLALLLEGVYILNGHGAFSTAHTEADVAYLAAACRQVARRVKAAG